ARLAAGAEPLLARLRPERVVGVELRARLYERGRGDAPVRVRIPDRPGEQQDAALLDGEAVDGHCVSSSNQLFNSTLWGSIRPGSTCSSSGSGWKSSTARCPPRKWPSPTPASSSRSRRTATPHRSRAT